MNETQPTPKSSSTRDVVRGVLLGCGVQFAAAALVGAMVTGLASFGLDPSIAQFVGLLGLGGVVLAVVLTAIALARRNREKLSRGVLLSLPASLLIGVALSIGLTILVLATCNGSSFH